MKDTTVTIHPTIKQSVNQIIWEEALKEDISMGRALEKFITTSPLYQKRITDKKKS